MNWWSRATWDAIEDLAAGNTGVTETMMRLEAVRDRMEAEDRVFILKLTGLYMGLVVLAGAILCWVL